MPDIIELGLDTFGDVTFDSAGKPLSQAQVLRNVVAEAVLADQVGLSLLRRRRAPPPRLRRLRAGGGAGGDRRRRPRAFTSAPRSPCSAPTTRFASTSASRTLERAVERPRRGDPRPRLVHRVVSAVRLRPDALRGAVRGEARSVRGAPEASSRSPGPGTHAPAARRHQSIFPPIENGRLRTWVGVGGSPESVVRAARYGLPLMLAIIGGNPQRFAPYVELYHRALGAVRTSAAADRRAFARARRRHRRAGARGAVAALRGDDDAHRRGARLAARQPRAVRARGRARRLALRRLAGDRRPQDRRDRAGARRCRAST